MLTKGFSVTAPALFAALRLGLLPRLGLRFQQWQGLHRQVAAWLGFRCRRSRFCDTTQATGPRPSTGCQTVQRASTPAWTQARRMLAAENVPREDLSLLEWIEAVVDMVDAELVDDPDYFMLGSEPLEVIVEGVRAIRSRRRLDAGR
jgi:hypothetical protein